MKRNSVLNLNGFCMVLGWVCFLFGEGIDATRYTPQCPEPEFLAFHSDVLKMLYWYLGKFDHDLTVLPNPGIMVFIGEIIPFYGLNSGWWIIIIYPVDMYWSLLATGCPVPIAELTTDILSPRYHGTCVGTGCSATFATLPRMNTWSSWNSPAPQPWHCICGWNPPTPWICSTWMSLGCLGIAFRGEKTVEKWQKWRGPSPGLLWPRTWWTGSLARIPSIYGQRLRMARHDFFGPATASEMRHADFPGVPEKYH